MFAILKQSMDSSPVSRCSANVPSPPSLVKHIRTEFDHEATSKTNSIGMIEISGQDASILEARNSPSDSEMLKQRLEIFWKDLKQHLGTSIVQDKENGAIDNLAAVNAKEQEATPKVIAHVDKSPQIVLQPTGLPSHAMGFTPDHIAKEALFRTSLLSKQSQSGVRDYIPNKDLGVLLPPPPKLATPYISATSTSTPFPQPVSCTVADGKPSSTSKKANFHTDEMSTKIKCNTTVTLCDPRAEMPLDLSIQAAGKKRHHDAILNCTTTRRRNEEKAVDSEQTDDQHDDDAALASVRSNFPSLTRYRNQVTTDKKMTLSAHIKNGLSNDTPAPHMGPFTSFYQDPESYATASGRTVSEVVQGSVPPLQLQQWLLAALSAQKWQQMALNQISLLQQQQQLIGDADPPKKRQKHDVGNQQPLSQLFQPSINQQQPGILFSQLNKNNSHSQSNKPDSFPTSHLRVLKDSSPNISPDSTQNQSGKRYRRYAKPPYSYVSLITLSILSSRSKKLRLSQILKRISEMFPFFNGSYQGWRDSVRHNLSQNECFVKVLKNPYRPTAKGNFWTVNLSSIPHELLLRQNTLVSRYAQDSGYRYRKDLSEVFDLRTGALKVSLPLHLVKDANEQSSSPLSNDPAAVMEAILLEETTDDQVNDYKDKISPAVRQFTLEDLFIQTDDGEDESTASNRIRCRNKSSTLSGHAPTFVQKSYANTVYQHNIESLSNSNGTAVTSSSSALDTPNNLELPPVLLPQTSDSRVQLPMALAGSAPNPFAASQTALLSKALAATQVLDSSFSLHKMLHTNQLLQNSLFAAASIPVVPQLTKQPPALSPVKKLRTPSPTIYQRDCHTSNQDMVADISSTSKRNKRKGVLPVRHTTSDYHTINGDSNNVPAGNAIESKEADCESPDCDTMERKVSSEAGSSSSHNFSSPITSSSGKSLLVSSPRHDESSEFEDSRQTIYEADPGTIIGVSRLQSLQVCGTPVAGNGDTMRPI